MNRSGSAGCLGQGAAPNIVGWLLRQWTTLLICLAPPPRSLPPSGTMGKVLGAKEVLLRTGGLRSCGKSARHRHPTHRQVAGHTVGMMRFDPYTADPDAHGHAFRLARHLAGCPLDPTIRKLVELRASQINGCAFCLDLHSGIVRHAADAQRKLDLLAGLVKHLISRQGSEQLLRWLKRWSRIGDGRRVSDETVGSRPDGVLDHDEIAGLLYTIGLIGLWNTLNVAVEFPAAAQLPTVR